jgi:hypothetical protein
MHTHTKYLSLVELGYDFAAQGEGKKWNCNSVTNTLHLALSTKHTQAQRKFKYHHGWKLVILNLSSLLSF